MNRINKDAMRSTMFRIIVIRKKNEIQGDKFSVFNDEINEDEFGDGDDENNDNEEEDEANFDDFLDLPFKCEIEIFRAKKKCLQTKKCAV